MQSVSCSCTYIVMYCVLSYHSYGMFITFIILFIQTTIHILKIESGHMNSRAKLQKG